MKRIMSLAIYLLLGLMPWFISPKKSEAVEAICATVKIEIEQELTFERVAFDARMTINNGLVGIPLNNVEATVNIQDSEKNDASSSFSIQVFGLNNIAAIDGSGTVEPDTSAEIHWLIIPSPGAGGTDPAGQVYYVSATLEYELKGEEQVTEVAPDIIVVRPQPVLVLDYFYPEFVYGDDPFTTETEAPIPYDIGVRIKNTGYGGVKNLVIESGQPIIKDNEQGLLIDFKILNSWVNDEPVQPTLMVDFGDIDPGACSIARWKMISSLMGQFISFETEFAHSDELGGELTSLIQDVYAHLLIKDVLIDLPGKDNIKDFLARDGDSIRVYSSDGLDEQVIPYRDEDATTTGAPSNQDPEITVAVSPTGGPLYVKISEPGGGNVEISSVVRSDGKRLLPDNFWISKERRGDHTWSHYLNIFDYNSPGLYTVKYTYGGAVGNIYVDPLVLSFDNIPINQSKVLETVISNNGIGTLSVTGIALLPESDSEFSMVSFPSLPVEIPTGNSIIIGVSYTPTGYAKNRGTLAIDSNDADEPTILVALSGTGNVDEDDDGIPAAFRDANGNIVETPLCSGGETQNCVDNCPDIYNPGQEDKDGDGKGDLCDPCDNRTEPDNDFTSAMQVIPPFASMDTCIDSPGDIDFYRVYAVSGSRMTAVVSGSASQGLDAVLGVFDPCLNLIYFNDNNGSTPYPALRNVPLPVTGTYYIAVSSSPDFQLKGGKGTTSGPYVLSLDLSMPQGDLDEDGDIDGKDLTLLASTFGSEQGDENYLAICDLNDNGIINSDDLSQFAKWYANSPMTGFVMGDIDHDGDVDGIDTWLFANAYGTSQGEERYNPSCDLNHDGNINNLDLAILASNSGGTVCEED